MGQHDARQGGRKTAEWLRRETCARHDHEAAFRVRGDGFTACEGIRRPDEPGDRDTRWTCHSKL